MGKPHSETSWIIMHDPERDRHDYLEYGGAAWFCTLSFNATRAGAWNGFLDGKQMNRQWWQRRGFRAVKVRVEVVDG